MRTPLHDTAGRKRDACKYRSCCERNATRPSPVTVIVFFAGSVLLWADRSNFSVAAAAWAKDLNWTPSTIGLMLSAFSLGYLVIQPIGGWIADQIGPAAHACRCDGRLVALGG